MASARDWLDCGLQILAAHGAPALTIERLTERMGLSKGSFYHHFGGKRRRKRANDDAYRHCRTRPRVAHVDVKSVESDLSLREFIAGATAYQPAWLRGLFAARVVFAKLLRLERPGLPKSPPVRPDAVSFNKVTGSRSSLSSTVKTTGSWCTRRPIPTWSATSRC